MLRQLSWRKRFLATGVAFALTFLTVGCTLTFVPESIQIRRALASKDGAYESYKRQRLSQLDLTDHQIGKLQSFGKLRHKIWTYTYGPYQVAEIEFARNLDVMGMYARSAILVDNSADSDVVIQNVQFKGCASNTRDEGSAAPRQCHAASIDLDGRLGKMGDSVTVLSGNSALLIMLCPEHCLSSEFHGTLDLVHPTSELAGRIRLNPSFDSVYGRTDAP